jgi:hypothetical protein
MQRVIAPAGSHDILYGEAPFGWSLSSDRSRLVKNGDEQNLLAVVRHMYFAERLPMRLVVERLRELGVMNRRGKPFTLSSVFTMIHHPRREPPEATRKKGR